MLNKYLSLIAKKKHFKFVLPYSNTTESTFHGSLNKKSPKHFLKTVELFKLKI